MLIEHLQKALALKVPDTRHHLLIDFYLLRAYGRLGRISEANSSFKCAQETNQRLRRMADHPQR